MSFSDENEIKGLLVLQPFYNVIIEKPKIKHVNNVDMLSELPCYDELHIVKTAKPFKKYSRFYNTEILKNKDGNMNDSLAQLQSSKPVINPTWLDFSENLKARERGVLVGPQ